MMILKTTGMKWAGFLISIIIFLLSFLGSIVLGYTDISISMVIDAYTQFDQSNEHLIIKNERTPRAFVATTVGASLAIAGAIIQALTKNPLASPGILGINAGAGFSIVVAVSFFSISSINHFIWIAFLGASIASITVYLLGSLGREGLSPLKLILAGAAIAALFSSLTQGILVMNEKALDEVLFWLAGSVKGRKLEYLLDVLPYLITAWIGALFIAKPLNILTMGEDVARGLGQRTVLVKSVALLFVVLLAGGSVAIAGPITFIGIVIPNITRSLVGTDHRWIIPYSGILGSILLLLADISARYVIMPQEVPVGVMTAIIGTPFFIYLARRGISK